MNRCNQDLRIALKQNNLKQWQLADLLNVSEATIGRWFRHELPTEQKKIILNVIKKNKQN